ncbi:hypothetical protein CsatB_018647 [Cannabis sativa]
MGSHCHSKDRVCESCLTGGDSILKESAKKDRAVTRAMSNKQFSGTRGTRSSTFKEPKGGKTKDVPQLDHSISNVIEGDHSSSPPDIWRIMDQPDDEIDEDEEVEDIISDDPNEEEENSSTTKGVVKLAKIIADKLNGIKRHLKFNKKGKSIGTPNRELQCYLGMQAKTMVPITIDHWRHVPAAILDNLWKDVNEAFYLNDGMRKEILSSVSIKWRHFKTSLNRKFVAPYLENPDLLKAKPHALEKPPPLYKGITEKTWKQFVSIRATKEFQEYRKKQQERRAGIKSPHGLSSRSYNEIEADLRSEFGANESIDRSILWKEATEDSSGDYRTELDELTTNAIDNPLEKRKAGGLVEIGKNDVLTQALGSSKHPRRVRSQSQGVSQIDCFPKPTEGVRESQEQHGGVYFQDFDKLQQSFDEKLKSREVESKKERDMFLAKFAELSSQIATLQENLTGHSSTSMPTTSPIYETPTPMEGVGEFCTPMNIETTKTLQETQKCKLLGKKDGDVVAVGEVIAKQGNIHGKPLGKGNYCVVVNECLDKNAEIPIPNGNEKTLVAHVVNSSVAWPSHLIIHGDEEISRKRAKKNEKNVSLPIALMTQEKTHPSIQLPNQIDSTPLISKIPNELPKYLRILFRSIKYMEAGLIFQVQMDAELLGHPHILCISQEDIIRFGLMEKVGVPCISFYIRVLYSELANKDINHFIGFLEPSFSSNVGAIEVERARLISIRLDKSIQGQFWLLPYHLRYHWTLIIIDKDHQICYFLDALGNPPPEDLKLLMSMVFDKNGGAKWRTIECPRQSSTAKCGFYVLKMMKDFVTNEAPIRWLNFHCSEKNPYTLEEINEVRDEWAFNLIEWMP